MPSGKASIRDRFTKQLEALKTTAENWSKADKIEEQRKWLQLDRNEWDGNLFDLEGMSKPFDRKEIAQDAKDAVKDAGDPGNVGDLILTTTQGDLLAAMERAFRARHMTSVRIRAHAAARRKGHGHEAGPIMGGIKGHVEQIEKLSKDNPSE